MSNRAYDIFKDIVTIYIPALLTLFVTVAKIWNWDIPVEAIAATVTAIEAFLGVILKNMSKDYASRIASEE